MSDSRDTQNKRDPLLDADLTAPFFELPRPDFAFDENQYSLKRLTVIFVFAAPILFFLALLAFFIFSFNSPQRTLATFLFGFSLLTTVGFALLARSLLKSLFQTFENSQHYLQHSEEQFRLLANSIPDLVSVARGDGTGLWYNDAWYRYTGSSPQDSQGINWKHVHHPDHFPRVFSEWVKAVETGKAFEIQFPLRGSDGLFRRFLYRATPIKNRAGQVSLWFGTATDIENEMIRRDDFLSIASHEIKTPLTSLNLQIQLLEKAVRTYNEPLPANFADSILICRQQIDKIITLINTVLDLSQLQLGTLKLNKTRMDLTLYIQDVCKRFRSEAEAKGIVLNYQSGPSLIGHWDPVRIEQILMNLLSNALKYGKGNPILVKTELVPGKPYACFSVEDDGDGISPQVGEKIFDRFSTANPTGKPQGLGLGLFICKQLVNAHGGSICFDSGPSPKGAKFIVQLPLETP